MPRLKNLTIVLFLIAIVFSPFAQGNATKLEITSDYLRVRKNKADGPVLRLLRLGGIYPILEHQDEWYRIELENGWKGWVSQNHVRVIQEASKSSMDVWNLEAKVEDLRVRESRVDGKIIAELHKGTRYSILDQQEGWYQIQLKSGRKGWVSGNHILAYGSGTDVTFKDRRLKVLAENLRVRENPMDGEVIAQVVEGDVFPILRKNGGWYQIRLGNGKRAWISAEYTEEMIPPQPIEAVVRIKGLPKKDNPSPTPALAEIEEKKNDPQVSQAKKKLDRVLVETESKPGVSKEMIPDSEIVKPSSPVQNLSIEVAATNKLAENEAPVSQEGDIKSPSVSKPASLKKVLKAKPTDKLAPTPKEFVKRKVVEKKDSLNERTIETKPEEKPVAKAEELVKANPNAKKSPQSRGSFKANPIQKTISKQEWTIAAEAGEQFAPTFVEKPKITKKASPKRKEITKTKAVKKLTKRPEAKKKSEMVTIKEPIPEKKPVLKIMPLQKPVLIEPPPQLGKTTDIAGVSKLGQLQWQTLESEHFLVYFHQGMEELARMSAAYAEESHALLSPVLDWEPEEKVHVIVSDTMDQQNGHASGLPYPALHIFPNAPEISGVIAEYESQDWLRALILHEYFHILHLDTVAGYSKLIRAVFGRPGTAPHPVVNSLFLFLNSPNNFVPLWLWEGLAVYFETEYTHSGRGRSPRSEMVLRMAALKDQLLRLDQIDFHRPGIPGENARYLYGGYFVNYLVNGNPNISPRELNHDLASKLPYMGTSTIEDRNGANLPEMYAQFRSDQNKKQQEQINILKSQALTRFRSHYSGGYQQKSFALSPDEQQIAFVESSGNEGNRIRIWQKKNRRFETLIEQNAYSLTWHPSGDYLFYTAAVEQGITTYRELFIFSFRTGLSFQLTENGRVGAIDLAADGKSLIAVESERGHQNLVMYDLVYRQKNEADEAPFLANRVKKLTNYRYSRVSSPRWDHQGQRVVYSFTDRKGVTILPILDVSAGAIIHQIRDGHLQSSPVWERKDQAILFSSDHSGVSNIYRYDLESGDFKPVTHVLGGAFMPLTSPKSQRLYFQNYNDAVLELASMEWVPKQVRSDPLPSIKSTWILSAEMAKKRDQSTVPVVDAFSEPYQGWNLRSQFWFLYGDEEPGGYAWGAITAGEDPLGQQAYFATLTLGKEKTYHQFSYTNDEFLPTVTFNSSLLPRRYPYGLSVPHLWETVHDAGLTLSFKVEGQWDVGGGWLYRYQEPFRDSGFVDSVNANLTGQIEQSIGTPIQGVLPLYKTTRDYFNSRTFIGKRQGLHAFISYSNLKHYPLSISEEEGSSFTLSLTRFPNRSGSNPKIVAVDGNAFNRILTEFKNENPEKEGLTSDQKAALIKRLKNENRELSNDHTLLIGNYTSFYPLAWQHQVLKFEFSRGVSLKQNESQALFSSGYDIPLRGYRKYIETAQQFSALSLEWRMPITQIFRGEAMLPFYFRQLHAGFFYDYASFSGDFQSTDAVVDDEIFYIRDIFAEQIRRSFGLELKLLSDIGYRYPLNLVFRLSNAVDINEIYGARDEKIFWAELDYEWAF
ncbi:MAG: SH3 domain-containing protein [SAR324 cluster bacterium]|nr:SH3 domain-containing protein [SAR324 cluster bacterium]